MTRSSVIALVCLLAGAAMTVVVAWGCVACAAGREWSPGPAEGPDRAVIVDLYAREMSEGWAVIEPREMRRPGVTSFGFKCVPLASPGPDAPFTDLKGWDDAPTEHRWWSFAGWPSPCFSSKTLLFKLIASIRYSPRVAPQGRELGIRVEQSALGNWPADTFYFPTALEWKGAAIDTLVYAGVIAALWPGRRAAMRLWRVRRGLCPGCAYPVGVSEVCTECGGKVAARAGAAG